MIPYAYRRPLRLTNADRDAWAAYERANARAYDMYEALPTSHRRMDRTRRCACGVITANARCRWCQDERKP